MEENKAVLGFSLVFLFLFLVTLFLVETGFFSQTDNLVNSYFSSSPNALLTKFSLVLAFLFEPLLILVASLIAFLLFYFHRFKKKVLFFFISFFLAGVSISLIKEIAGRARPQNLIETGFSFPSGHTVVSVILFCGLIYLMLRNMKSNWKYVLSGISVLFILVISLSRLYLGVHWFSDILGGFLLGGFIFLATLYFFEKK